MHLSFGMLFSDTKKTYAWKKIAQKYPVFTYESYKHTVTGEDLVISFVFSFSKELTFHPTIVIKNIPLARYRTIPKTCLDNMVFHLGIIEGFSYWKACASKKYAVTCGALTKEQVQFFKHVLCNGMGEYAYTNAIDISYIDEVQFTSLQTSRGAVYAETLSPNMLIPVGGGKDSAVTIELTKSLKKERNAFLLNPVAAAIGMTAEADFKNPVVVERTLDPLLLSLNKQGYLNGHTPFSAYLAFLATTCAVIFDYQEIVLSNECSANVGNVTYQGKEINHQYSKSFDFEQAFHNYAKKYIAINSNYYSLLRPLNELQIAKLFSTYNREHAHYLRYNQYFGIFVSCNVGQKENRWCGNCAKCLFVFATLYPFLPYEQLMNIFNKDLFTDKNLLAMLKDLLGVTKQKPFDCVGTYQEVRAACYLSLANKKPNQVLLNYFEKEVMPKYPAIQTETNALLSSFDNSNLLSEEYKQLLQKILYE